MTKRKCRFWGNVSRDSEFGMMARQDLKVLIKKEEVGELWIGATGASSHMCKVGKGCSNTKNVNIKAEFAREDHEGKVDKIGTWTGIVQVLNKETSHQNKPLNYRMSYMYQN